jgi:hypothetical protein
VSAYVFWILSARISAAIRPTCTLSVAKTEVKALESAVVSMATTFTFLAASSIGLLRAAECAGAITTAAGFDETAFSRRAI